jgi:hypothetical protein
MKANNISNNFLNADSDSKQNIQIFNENENNIDSKYYKIEQSQPKINNLEKEEKYKIHDQNHKKNIFDKNYGQKISLNSQANQSTTSKTQRNIKLSKDKCKDLSLDQYIEELNKKYEEDPIYYESMDETTDKNYYLFAFCYFCDHLAFAYKDQVTCVNKCFSYDIKTEEFSEKYPLDLFLESHYDFFDFHFECNGDIIFLFFDEKKKPFFICSVCDKKILEKAGIEL